MVMSKGGKAEATISQNMDKIHEAHAPRPDARASCTISINLQQRQQMLTYETDPMCCQFICSYGALACTGKDLLKVAPKATAHLRNSRVDASSTAQRACSKTAL